MTSEGMQVGVVADRLGLSVRTLHHWEEKGLVTPSHRSSGGFRLYTETDLERLLLIRRMKPLDFSLEEMRQLLDAFRVLAEEPGDASALAFVEHCRRRTAEGRAELVRKLTWADEFSALLADRLPGPAQGAEVGTAPGGGAVV
ncbi:MerR family transcriptional regulator [Microlunatus aurantiacus]|uniref:MerR family transcriptional regulator n=1 Tax=Microlunatus aurantiacus TaxID=446786 RepID=A0ABP7EEU2_9ACTN